MKTYEESDVAKAERKARNRVQDAIILLRQGQAILQQAEWQHDPFAALLEEAVNTYESLQEYSKP